MPFSAVWLVLPATSLEPEPVKLMAVVAGAFWVLVTSITILPVMLVPGMV